mgnify:CR=1 FL=1
MIKILINGCNGKMGQVVSELAKKDVELEIAGGFDISKREEEYPIFTSIEEINVKPDVIIDFSIPQATFNILEFALKTNTPIVIATTGFTDEQNKKIEEYSKKIAIFKSANMSFDVTMMKNLLKQIAPKLEGTDIEITEIHHNRKIDSPSGTAQMFADSINEVLENKYHCEYNRHDKHEKRDKYEIGMNSIRGGNIVGEHIVQFFGEYETFEIKHTSYSRNVFAEGALKATKFVKEKKQGLYSMDDMLN